MLTRSMTDADDVGCFSGMTLMIELTFEGNSLSFGNVFDVAPDEKGVNLNTSANEPSPIFSI